MLPRAHTILNKEVSSKPSEETETCCNESSGVLWSRLLSVLFFFFIVYLCILTVHLWNEKERSSNGLKQLYPLPSLFKSTYFKMNSSNKLAQSSAIRAEVKRHESVQNTINKLFKQFERVGDQQLRSGLKVYLHSIQGKLSYHHSRCKLCLTRN